VSFQGPVRPDTKASKLRHNQRLAPHNECVSNPEYVVREAHQADADAITTVHEARWRAGYAHLFSQDVLEKAIRQHCSRWARVLANPEFENTTLLVLEHQQQIIGFAHFGPSGNELSSYDRSGRAELYSFYVHPDRWGTGAASVLLEQVIEILERRGDEAVYLNTAAETPRSRRFYEKHGFRETGSTSVYQLLGEVPSVDVEYIFRILRPAREPGR
jgi:ribosomal protein S18 acetylase RimI-like enzyme